MHRVLLMPVDHRGSNSPRRKWACNLYVGPRGRRSVKVISRVGTVHLGGILCTTNASWSCPQPRKTSGEGRAAESRREPANNDTQVETIQHPREITASFYRGPHTPEWKVYVFHFSRHIPEHTHTHLLTCSLLNCREHQITGHYEIIE